MPPRIRNYPGYPSTQYGRQRRLARAGVQKAARQALFSAMRAPRAAAPFVRGFDRTAGFYGRYSGAAPELKFFDTDLGFNIDTTLEVPATGQLSLIPQGVTQSTRVGRKATVKSIYIHGTAALVPGAAAAPAGNAIMWLVQDTQCNGAAATASGATGVMTTANIDTANMNLANGQRFKIIKKFTWSFNPPAGATTAYTNVFKTFSFYKKCQIPIEFDAAADTGAITTIRSNNIFLLAGSTGNADDLVSVVGVCRLRFSDS